MTKKKKLKDIPQVWAGEHDLYGGWNLSFLCKCPVCDVRENYTAEVCHSSFIGGSVRNVEVTCHCGQSFYVNGSSFKI